MGNKITRNTLKARYDEIYAFGYCEIHYLEKEIEKIGYNSNDYNGWNYDAYDFGNVCLTTGYRGMISKNENNEKRQAILKANEEIKNIKFDYSLSYTETEEKIKNVLTNLFDKLIEK